MATKIQEFHRGIQVELEIVSSDFGLPRDPEKRAGILATVTAHFRTATAVTLAVSGVTVTLLVPKGTTFEDLDVARRECCKALDEYYFDMIELRAELARLPVHA